MRLRSVRAMTTTEHEQDGPRRGEDFDPAFEAAEAVAEGRDPLEVVIGTGFGYASACWENLRGAGVFESDRARQAADATVAWLREQQVVRVGPGRMLVLQVPAETSAAELQAIAAELRQAREQDRAVLVSDAIRVFVADGAAPVEAQRAP